MMVRYFVVHGANKYYILWLDLNLDATYSASITVYYTTSSDWNTTSALYTPMDVFRTLMVKTGHLMTRVSEYYDERKKSILKNIQ